MKNGLIYMTRNREIKTIGFVQQKQANLELQGLIIEDFIPIFVFSYERHSFSALKFIGDREDPAQVNNADFYEPYSLFIDYLMNNKSFNLTNVSDSNYLPACSEIFISYKEPVNNGGGGSTDMTQTNIWLEHIDGNTQNVANQVEILQGSNSEIAVNTADTAYQLTLINQLIAEMSTNQVSPTQYNDLINYLGGIEASTTEHLHDYKGSSNNIIDLLVETKEITINLDTNIAQVRGFLQEIRDLLATANGHHFNNYLHLDSISQKSQTLVADNVLIKAKLTDIELNTNP